MPSQLFVKVCKKRTSRAIALFISLLFLVNGYSDSSAAQSRRFQQDNARLVFTSKNNVRVENSTGNIEVELNPRNSIEVTANNRGSAQQSVRSDELSISQSPNQIWITVKPSNPDKEIDVKLSVPEGAILKLFSQTGDIKITGAAAGGLAKTDSGNIILNLPDRINADIVLSSNSGTVQSTRNLNSSATSNRHFLHGQLGEGGAILAAYSEFGQVVLARLGEEPTIAQNPSPEIESSQRDISTIQKIKSKSTLPALRKSDDRPDPAAATTTVDSANDEMADNVLKIESQLVSVNASVSDSRGEPIVHLRKEDFNLYEDGVQQEIVHFQPVNTPFNMVLLIDLSGSVREKISLIKKAARRFIQAARSDDKVAVVTFSSSTRVICPLTNDRNELYRRIDDIKKPDGGTNFYDAVDDTISRVLSNVSGERNVIVIMSDGVDNALPGVPGRGSDISYSELYSRVQESDALIFPIYLDTEAETVDDFGPEIGKSYETARAQLKELADATGGVMFYANRVEDLEGRYDQVAAELRTIYSLGYYPTSSSRDGSYHKIRVRVSASDAHVRARRGYYQK